MQLIRATWPLQTHTHTHIYSSFVWNCCPRRQAPCDITEKLCALFKGSPLKKHYLYSSLRKLIWYYHLLIAVSTGSRRPWHKNLSICHPSGPLSFHISLSVGWYTAVTCLFEMTCVSQIIYHLVPHNVSEKFHTSLSDSFIFNFSRLFVAFYPCNPSVEPQFCRLPFPYHFWRYFPAFSAIYTSWWKYIFINNIFNIL